MSASTSTPEFKNFDDPFLYFTVDGKEYCWNPDYGTLINMGTDKQEEPTEEMLEFVGEFYEDLESGVFLIDSEYKLPLNSPSDEGR